MRTLLSRTLFLIIATLSVHAAAFAQLPPHRQLEQSQQQPQADGSAQARPQQPHTKAVPDHVLYSIFFRQIANLDQAANKMDSEGKNGNELRTHVQRAAGLQESEGVILKQVAADCNKALRDNEAQAREIITRMHAQYPKGAYLKLAPPAELVQLDEDRKQIVNEHITQLRTALDEPSFARLDGYMRSLIKTTVTELPAARSANRGVRAVTSPAQASNGGAR